MRKLLTVLSALMLAGSVMIAQEHTYTVAGSEAAFGTNWDTGNTDNDMVLENGLYKLVKENVSLSENVEFKVVQDHAWDNAWPGGNYVLNIPEAGVYTLTITFDPANNNAVYARNGRYFLASGSLPDGDWASDGFELDGDNRIVFEGLPAATYSFKITDGTWNWSLGYANRDETNSSNVTLSDDNGNLRFITSVQTDVTIAFDPVTEKITVNAASAAPSSDTYTVAGNSEELFGTTWDTGNTDNDMVETDGVFRFVKEDVILPAGEIGLKVCRNHSWEEGAYPSGLDNYILEIPSTGIYTITVTFDPSNSGVSAEATKTGDAVIVPSIAMHGTFTGEWAGTELFTVSEDKSSASLTMTISANAIAYQFGLRIGSSTDWTANGASFTRANASAVVESGEGNLTLVADATGEYTFTWTYETNTLTVTYPEETGEQVGPPSVTLKGSWDNWEGSTPFIVAEDGKSAYLTKNLEYSYGLGFHDFKIILGGSEWRSNGYTFHPHFTGADNITGDMSDNMSIKTNSPNGPYTFIWTYETNSLSIIFPANPYVEMKGSWNDWGSTLHFDPSEDGCTATAVLALEEHESISFKMLIDNEWRSNGKSFGCYWEDLLSYSNITQNEMGDMRFCPDYEGEYLFIWTYGTNGLRITDHEVRPSVEIKGSWDEWTDPVTLNLSQNESYASATRIFDPGDYEFKIVINGNVWLGNGETFNRDHREAYNLGEGDNMILHVDVTGDYTFTWHFGNESFDITFPELNWTEVRSDLVNGRYYTICVDKAVRYARGATFWSLSKRNEAGTIAYLEEENTPFAAGMPYIFLASEDRLEVVFDGDAVTEPVANGALRGNLEVPGDPASDNIDQHGIDAIAVAENSPVYILSNNELRRVDGQTGNMIRLGRAYIVYNDLISVSSDPLPVTGRRVTGMPLHPKTTTGIENLYDEETQCSKILIDGHLFILHGTKLYDLTGRNIK